MQSGYLFQRTPGKSNWIMQYYLNGKARQESCHTTDRKKAERLLNQKLAALAAGQPVGPVVDKTSFEDLARIIEDEYKVNGRKSGRRIKTALGHLRGYFGNYRARAITGEKLVKYVAHRQAESASNATINRELACLRRAFNLAARAGRVVSKPYFPMLQEDNVREGFLEQGQFAALRGALPADLRDPITFLWLTGWRVGEMQTLEWSSVLADAIRLQRENSKNKRGRELPLAGELGEVIERAREARKAHPQCPFVFHRNGKGIKDFWRSWTTACDQAGLAGLKVHDLRRSAARNLIRAGVPENIAMRFTGHLTASIFRRYDVCSADDLADAQQRLGAYLAAQPATPKVVPLKRVA